MGEAAPSSPDVAELNEFFDSLPALVDLERGETCVSGTIRFDVEGLEPWHVSVVGGGRHRHAQARAGGHGRRDMPTRISSCGCYAGSRTRGRRCCRG